MGSVVHNLIFFSSESRVIYHGSSPNTQVTYSYFCWLRCFFFEQNYFFSSFQCDLEPSLCATTYWTEYIRSVRNIEILRTELSHLIFPRANNLWLVAPCSLRWLMKWYWNGGDETTSLDNILLIKGLDSGNGGPAIGSDERNCPFPEAFQDLPECRWRRPPPGIIPVSASMLWSPWTIHIMCYFWIIQSCNIMCKN